MSAYSTIGMVVDTRGLVPEEDARQLRALGTRIREAYAHPVAETHGAGWDLTLPIPAGQVVRDVLLMEDIRAGERIREFTLEGFLGEQWRPLARGCCVGHKRLVAIPSLQPSRLRLTIHRASDIPNVRRFAAFTGS